METITGLIILATAAAATVLNAQSPQDAVPPMPAGFVYTADEQGKSISVIDLGTGRVEKVVVRIMPHNVQTSRDGRLLLAVGSTGGMDKMKGPDTAKMKTERGRLLIFDTDTMAAEGATDIEIGRDPAHVVMDDQGKRAYADNSKDNNVLIVDLAQKKVVGEIKTGTFPHGLRMSPDGREIYVACVNDNSVSVINVAESKEVARIPVGQAPVQVGFTPDGRRVYVSLRDENSVAVIDVAQRKKIASVPVGRNPIQVFATPDGRYVYVANQGSETNPDDTVSVIETVSNRVVATITTGAGPHGVVISDDGSRAFITNTFAGTVSVIDTTTQKVIDTIKVGEGPGGITFRRATPAAQPKPAAVREFQLLAQETAWELLPSVTVKAWIGKGDILILPGAGKTRMSPWSESYIPKARPMPAFQLLKSLAKSRLT